MDWTLDWTGLEEVWVQLLLAIDYFIRDREVMVLWLQVSRSPGCCVICRCGAGYTRSGAVCVCVGGGGGGGGGGVSAV